MADPDLVIAFTDIGPKYTGRYFIGSWLEWEGFAFGLGSLALHWELLTKFRYELDSHQLSIYEVAFNFMKVVPFLHFEDYHFKEACGIRDWLDALNLLSILISVVVLDNTGNLFSIVPDIYFKNFALLWLLEQSLIREKDWIRQYLPLL